MVPLTIDGPQITDDGLPLESGVVVKDHSVLPVAALNAYTVPDGDPANITPLATVTMPTGCPLSGSGTCQRYFPVAASRAAHKPAVSVEPPLSGVYGLPSVLETAQ